MMTLDDTYTSKRLMNRLLSAWVVAVPSNEQRLFKFRMLRN